MLKESHFNLLILSQIQDSFWYMITFATLLVHLYFHLFASLLNKVSSILLLVYNSETNHGLACVNMNRFC